jgi:hypothetical protein
MSVGYILVNATRREQIAFRHLPASTKREIAGHPAAAVVAWYLLEHPGDAIAFVNDHDDVWPFAIGTFGDLSDYADMTDQVVADLIAAGILRDDGMRYVDEDDPDVFIRDLTNIWDSAATGESNLVEIRHE